MRIIRDDGSKVDVPKVRPIASELALGTCEVCNLSFSSGRAILQHGQEDCTEEDRKKNCGVIRVDLGRAW
jgi:hypothetical protein